MIYSGTELLHDMLYSEAVAAEFCYLRMEEGARAEGEHGSLHISVKTSLYLCNLVYSEYKEVLGLIKTYKEVLT